MAEVAAASEITLTSLPNPTVVQAVADEWASAAAAGLGPARAVHHAARQQPGHRRPARGQRPPLRRGAAHRRRHRRPEPRPRVHGRRRRRAGEPLPPDPRAARPGHLPPRSGRHRHHHEAGQQPAGDGLHLGVVRVAVARRQGRHRPAHRGRGDPHRRRHELLHRPRRRGHQRPRQAGRVHPGAGGQGRRPHQRDRRGHRRARRDRQGRVARCSTTPSPAASATTTGPTSCSPPRREPSVDLHLPPPKAEG